MAVESTSGNALQLVKNSLCLIDEFCKQTLNQKRLPPLLFKPAEKEILSILEAIPRMLEQNSEPALTLFDYAIDVMDKLRAMEFPDVDKYVSRFYLLKAMYFIKTSQHEIALKDSMASLQFCEDNNKPECLYWVAKIYYETNDLTMALKYLEDCFSLNENDEKVHLLRDLIVAKMRKGAISANLKNFDAMVASDISTGVDFDSLPSFGDSHISKKGKRKKKKSRPKGDLQTPIENSLCLDVSGEPDDLKLHLGLDDFDDVELDGQQLHGDSPPPTFQSAHVHGIESPTSGTTAHRPLNYFPNNSNVDGISIFDVSPKQTPSTTRKFNADELEKFDYIIPSHIVNAQETSSFSLNETDSQLDSFTKVGKKYSKFVAQQLSTSTINKVNVTQSLAPHLQVMNPPDGCLKDQLVFSFVCYKCIVSDPVNSSLIQRVKKHSEQCDSNLLICAEYGKNDWYIVRQIQNLLHKHQFMLCKHYNQSCLKKENCPFAHNAIELRVWNLEHSVEYKDDKFEQWLMSWVKKQPNVVETSAKGYDPWDSALPNFGLSGKVRSNNNYTNALPTIPSNLNNTDITSVDFKLACNQCYRKVGGQSSKNVYNGICAHQCKENLLIGSFQSSPELFHEIRECSNPAHMGDYILCWDYESMCYRKSCPFAHNQVEILVWNAERKKRFNRNEMISALKLRSGTQSLPASITSVQPSQVPPSPTSPSKNERCSDLQSLVAQARGEFVFLCKECLQGNPQLYVRYIVGDNCCTQNKKHLSPENKLLYNIRPDENSVTGSIFECIRQMKLGYDHNIPISVCKHALRGYPHQMENCRFAHSIEEKMVWELRQHLNISDEEIVIASIDAKIEAAERLSSVVMQLPYSIAKLHCGLCYQKKILTVKDKHSEHCFSNDKHPWNEDNCILYVELDGRKFPIRSMPTRYPPNGEFKLCKNAKKIRENCLEAHGPQELFLWNLMLKNSVRSLSDIVNAIELSKSNFTSFDKVDVEKQVDSHSSRFYCYFCQTSFKRYSDFDSHNMSDRHQSLITTDSDMEWHYRPPPFGVHKLEICSKLIKGTCPYQSVDRRSSKCKLAHSQEELDEWHERIKYREMKQQRAFEEDLFSYIDDLKYRLSQTVDKSSVMVIEMNGVSLECDSLSKDSDFKDFKDKWKINIITSKELHQVALLDDMWRTHFSFSGKHIADGCHYINDCSQFVVGEDNYQIEVEFNGGMYGSFKQTLILDFNEAVVLGVNLSVDLGASDLMLELCTQREEIKYEGWDMDNCEVVAYGAREWDELIRSYPLKDINDIVNIRNVSSDFQLGIENYHSAMHNILYIEEAACSRLVSVFNCTTDLDLMNQIDVFGHLSIAPKDTLFAMIHLHTLPSEDTVEGKLMLRNVTSVLIRLVNDATGLTSKKIRAFEANVFPNGNSKFMSDKGMYVHLSREAVQLLPLDISMSFRVEVMFVIDRESFAKFHSALDSFSYNELLFPQQYGHKTFVQPKLFPAPHRSKLNEKQALAMGKIMCKSALVNPPIILHGLLGMGKTFTIAQSIMQLIEIEESRLLICTKTNSAADLFIINYLDKFLKEKSQHHLLLRVMYESRNHSTVDKDVLKYCIKKNDGFLLPTFDQLMGAKVVISTVSTCFDFLHDKVNKLKGMFTHILIDEAGQILELDCVIPLLVATQETKVVLSGDYLQMGPQVCSPLAHRLGFQKSMLQRLIEHYELEGSPSPFIIRLTENYRSCPEIANFLSSADIYGTPIEVRSENSRHPKYYPLTFFSVRGVEENSIHSNQGLMSYFNVTEVMEIVHRIEEIIGDWPSNWGTLNLKTIAVLTCYTEQVKYIRSELRKRNLSAIVVSTVENIQGYEYRVVFISTVRTKDACDEIIRASICYSHDVDNCSFMLLSDTRMVYTAISRAKSLVCVIGDPMALCTIGDCKKFWRHYILTAFTNDSLYGASFNDATLLRSLMNM